MTDFKTSETAKNLMRAFAGESQARNRYTFAAGLAKEQKMPMVEAVFSYTADQEKEHAEIFYDYLKPLDKETIFIDGVLKQADISIDNLSKFLEKLNKISKENNIEFVISVSAERKEIPNIDSPDYAVLN